MAKTLAQIQKEIQTLEREAEAIRNKEKTSVLAQIKDSMARYGISAADLGLGGKGEAKAPGKRGPYKKRGEAAAAKPTGTAKYRDSDGNTWSGRGPKPKWFKAALAAGKSPDDLKA